MATPGPSYLEGPPRFGLLAHHSVYARPRRTSSGSSAGRSDTAGQVGIAGTMVTSKIPVRYRWQAPPACTSEDLGCKLIDMSVRVNLDKFMAIDQPSQTFKAQFFYQAETTVPKDGGTLEAEQLREFLKKLGASGDAGPTGSLWRTWWIPWRALPSSPGSPKERKTARSPSP
ncbi:unnamed protein product [Symbiodinium sp. CCMP2592]|nr:unnamed protein product [Symbiodinium sp. CCMP2592]